MAMTRWISQERTRGGMVRKEGRERGRVGREGGHEGKGGKAGWEGRTCLYAELVMP